MSIVKDLLSVAIKVKSLLINSEQIRDNDKKLWLTYMLHNSDLHSIIKTGDWDLFEDIILDKNTPTFETISRARRLVQAEYPELAGNKRKRLEIATEVKELLK